MKHTFSFEKIQLWYNENIYKYCFINKYVSYIKDTFL